MANPVQERLWGSDMSHEGVQNRGKDGGAHGIPHESSFDDGILYLSKNSLSSDVHEIADANSLRLQDGGTLSLLPGDGEDMSVDMYPYDSSVHDNAEWMKSKCKSLSIDFEGVGEENVGDILGLGSESKVDNLMTIGGQFLAEDGGINILCSDGVSLVTPSSISSGNDARCSDIIPLCNMPDDLNSRSVTDKVLCPPPSSQNSNSLLCVNNGAVNVFSEMPSSLDASTFSAFTEKTNSVEESRASILEAFPTLTSSQSLITTSPIAAVATSGSDNSLTGILPNFLGIDSTLHNSPGNDLGSLHEGGSSIAENFQQNGFLVNDGSDLSTSASSDSAKVDLNDPSNVTLAMISVSTNKDANATQIVVNTSQGQQLYMINANLNQVNGNIPLPVAQQVENAVAVQGITATQPSGSPTSNHFVLLPIVNGNLPGSVLQTTSLLQKFPQDEGGEEREVYACPETGCDKAFSKPSKLKIHFMQHSGERPFKCSKEGCDWAFTTAYKLKRHEEAHEGNKDHICEYEGCNRKFTTIYNLKTHQRLHERPCTEKCPEEGCNASFPTKRHLETHMRVHNGEEKTYNCPYPGCKAVFYSAMTMGSHSRIHKEPEEDLRCNFDGCGKVFDRVCRLKQHMRQHTGEKPYVCNFEGCTWAFTTASKLKRHSAKHFNVRKYKCEQCGKGFMRPEHLKGHLIIHSGVRPFTCTVEGCDASFSAKSSLYVHMTKHNKEGGKMVFHCPMEDCARKYSTKALMRAHMLKHIAHKNADGVSGQDMARLLMGSIPDNPHDRGHAEEGDDGVEEEGGDAFREGGVEISSDQLTGVAVTQLLSSSVTINAETPTSVQPTISLESSLSRSVYLKNRSGCARTDFQSNHLISNQARQRWHQQREDSQMTAPGEMDTTPDDCEDGMLGLKQEPTLYGNPEPTLSGLTFRDPETGLTYVQTQLLQDDPPHAVYYSGEGLGLGADPGDPDASDVVGQSVLDMDPTHFAGTTINLNDLV